MDFFLGVIDLQRQDAEAVDDEARGFGVERSGLILRAGEVEELLVDLFHKIVAGLIEPVDGVLDLRDGGVGGVGAAGGVFLVPEIEVGTMLGEHEGKELIAGHGRQARGVPADVGCIVKIEDAVCVQCGGGVFRHED